MPWSTPKAISCKSKSRLPVSTNLTGAKQLLEPLKDLFPRLKLLWGDSHYGGTLIAWVKEQLGCDIHVVHRLGTASDASAWSPRPQSPASSLFPDVGWWSAALPGLPAGVASAAIMRDYLPVLKPSSNSRLVGACSRTSLLLFPEPPEFKHSLRVAFIRTDVPSRIGGWRGTALAALFPPPSSEPTVRVSK